MLRRSRRPKKSAQPNQATLIAAYFERDIQKKFYLEGCHGRGGQGCIYKVKYVTPGSNRSVARSFILKIADPQKGADAAGLQEEKALLQRFRGCRHIVRVLTNDEDPLKSAGKEFGWTWAYLEILQNDTLTSFLERTKITGLYRLPNRLLWLIFMCMIRACIAMAWPSDDPEQNETTIRGLLEPSGLVHNDIHGDNLLFGSYLEDDEHDLTPVLKLIDFGLAQELRLSGRDLQAGIATGEQRNIEDLGIMMAGVIRLETETKYTGEEIEVDLTSLNRGSNVLSPASGIIEETKSGDPDPHPGIDRDLRLVVAACMASNAADRPTLVELEGWASVKTKDTNPAHHTLPPNTIDEESDETIRRIVQSCLLNAP